MTSSKDDKELWQKFIQGVKPLDRKETTIPLNLPRKNLSFPKILFTPSSTASENFLYPYPCVESPLTSVAASKRLKKNSKISIDATLDLHGEILQNAHSILIKFIEKALRLNNRVILVITGKSLGKISHDRPRLIEMVPLWLQTPPLSQYVKKVTYAKREHGGEGAFYVFLKSLSSF